MRVSLAEKVTTGQFNLDACNLIEASAGTGKTFSIQTLFLRMVVEQGFDVRKILVVTFTEAATKELRDRLRRILHNAVLELDHQLPSDHDDRARIQEIMALPLNGVPDANRRNVQGLRLRRALLDFDSASVWTIHGFCSRVLEQYAFECGHDFNAELDLAGNELIRECCEDWWRQNIYGHSLVSSIVCSPNGFNLQKLMSCARTRCAKPDAHLRMPPLGADLTASVHALSDEWQAHGTAIASCMQGALNNGFLNVSFAQDLPSKLTRALAERAGAEDLVPLFLGFSKNEIPNHSRKNDYQLPTSLEPLFSVCKKVDSLIKAKALGTTKGSWNFKDRAREAEAHDALDALEKTADKLSAELQRFLQEDLRFFTKGILPSAENPSDYVAMLASASTAPAETVKTLAGALVDTRLQGGIRKNEEWEQDAATESFVTHCTALVKTVSENTSVILAAAIEEVHKNYLEAKKTSSQMSFDDLLLNVRNALVPGQNANFMKLLDVLKKNFSAALIDEFQDTDPVQYDIFRLAFIEAGVPTFLVGDPKQAIYGFRNGDIFTYYAAAGGVPDDRQYELKCNYRSAVPLVDGVNTIFRDGAAAGDGETPWRSFLRSEITYAGDLAAKGKENEKSLLVAGELDPQPFKIWLYEDASKAGPALDSLEGRRLYADTAEEIARLLNDQTTTIAGSRVKPGDIAVLIMTHDEASFIAEELRKRQVPAVLQSTGNIFDTLEAQNMVLLLRAMAEPGSLSAIRTLLVTDLVPLADPEIITLLRDDRVDLVTDGHKSELHVFDDFISLFRKAHDLWLRSSFIQAFNFVSRHLGLRATVARLERGERKLTNILHLAELIHHAAGENRLGIASLQNWLATQMNPKTREKSDSYELRLETDDAAVRIMTVFKSKGLQFPIVFVPTMWRRAPSARHKDLLEYHWESSLAEKKTEENTAPSASLHNGQLILDLDTINPPGKAKGEQESLEEDVRLIYVAVTRAVHRTYLVSGSLNNKKGALKYLLDAETASQLTTQLQQRHPPGVGFPFAIEARSFRNDGATTRYVPNDSQATLELLPPPPPKPNVNKDHGHTSFSKISHDQGKVKARVDDRFDFDATDEPGDDATKPPERTGLDVFSFPAGVRTGECWHAIFEHLAFNSEKAVIEQAVDEQLAVYGLSRDRLPEQSERKRQIVLAMVQNTLQAKMPGDYGDFSLNKLTPIQCRPEMEFNFPLFDKGKPRTAKLYDALNKSWTGKPERELFLQAAKSWNREIPKGFMTGFMDLVFRHDNGRYYILDWKSNRLDGTAESFHKERILQEMAAHRYFLQYLLYTVALHLHLKATLSNYRYEDHFGGVYYVFLRGTQAENERGIFYDLPEPELIQNLADILLSGGATAGMEADHE